MEPSALCSIMLIGLVATVLKLQFVAKCKTLGVLEAGYVVADVADLKQTKQVVEQALQTLISAFVQFSLHNFACLPSNIWVV